MLTELIVRYHIGEWASVAGLAVALVGFVLTLRSVKRSRDAARAAGEAVERVRGDIRRSDMLMDLGDVLLHMDELKKLIRDKSWPEIPERYGQLRRTLISIRSRTPFLTQEQKTVFQSAIQHLSSMESQVERALYAGKAPKDPPRHSRIISGEMDRLQTLLEEIRKDIGR